MRFHLLTIRKRADFLRARNGRYFAAPGLVLQLAPESKKSCDPVADSVEPAQKNPARFGFTVTKKVGNAGIRNRIRRRLRAAVREIAPQKARPGCEYVLIGRKSTLKRPFMSLLHDLTIAFDRVHGKRGKGNRPRMKGPRAGSGKNRNNRK